MLSEGGSLGEIGRMGESLESNQLFWRLAKGYGFGIDDLEQMSYDMMVEAASYLDMTLDYKNAWNAYYDIRSERLTKKKN